MNKLHVLLITVSLFGSNSCAAVNGNPQSISSMVNLHNVVCDQKISKESHWQIDNLYDCNTKKLFIPYQLWSGAVWDGIKSSECMHNVNSLFDVKGYCENTIVGPKKWDNPYSEKEETIWIRSRVDGSKVQYFTCHKKGIGRVYDSRRPKYYLSGRCKFPAGWGWEIMERRTCSTSTAIQITELRVDEDGKLTYLVFKWWVAGSLDHIYQYVPEYGMAEAWEQ